MTRSVSLLALALFFASCAGDPHQGQIPSPQSPPSTPSVDRKAPPKAKPKPPHAARKDPHDIEGKLISEVQIRFVGPATVDEARLRNLISTKVGGRYSNERVDTDIKDLYESGYTDDVRVLAEPAGEELRIIYEVFSRGLIGPGSSPKGSFVGNTAFSDERLATESGLAVGKKITPDSLAEARKKLEAYYRSYGYSQAKVELAWDGEDFSFQIEEGPKTAP